MMAPLFTMGLALVASPVDDIFRLAREGRWADAAARIEAGRFAPTDRHQLLGYLALRARDYPRAAEELDRVVARAPGRSAAWLYLGVARYRLDQPGAALRALVRAERSGRQLPGYFALRARSERLADTATTAWATLEAGLSRFETDAVLLREQVSLLIEVGALEAGLARTQPLLRVTNRPLADRVWVGRALIEAGALDRSTPWLEAALALALAREEDAAGSSRSEPSAVSIRAQLAWVYAQRGRPAIAARLLDPLRVGGSVHAYEAADQYRLSGETGRALAVNRFVGPPARRAAQRLLILVEAGELERAAAFGARMPPEELDPVGTYALAFALAHTGQLEAARAWLGRVSDRAAVPGIEALEEQLERLEGASAPGSPR